jgi:hypothetical protein
VVSETGGLVGAIGVVSVAVLSETGGVVGVIGVVSVVLVGVGVVLLVVGVVGVVEEELLCAIFRIMGVSMRASTVKAMNMMQHIFLIIKLILF